MGGQAGTPFRSGRTRTGAGRPSAPPLVPAGFLRGLARFARAAWGAAVFVVDGEGRLKQGNPGRDGPAEPSASGDADHRRHLVAEALRFGEAVARLRAGRLEWAVPLMVNARVVGGVVASLPERRVEAFDLRAADAELRRWLEAENLTNGALLELRRREHARERRWAEAIHAFKDGRRVHFPALYLQLEPALLAAIRKGERGAARGILNELLVAIHHQAGERLDLIKTFFMELVTVMCRNAVEAGAEPERMLGENYGALAELARTESMEDLGPWLHEILERLMDAIRRHRAGAPEALLHAALEYLRAHYRENISRDDAAHAVHVSPAHFSRVFRRAVGRSFTEALNRLRVDRAAEMLAGTDRGLAAVAAACGFRDASYFSKVFRRYQGVTPKRYRLRRRAAIPDEEA